MFAMPSPLPHKHPEVLLWVCFVSFPPFLEQLKKSITSVSTLWKHKEEAVHGQRWWGIWAPRNLKNSLQSVKLEVEPITKISRATVLEGPSWYLGCKGIEYLGHQKRMSAIWNKAKQIHNLIFVGAQERCLGWVFLIAVKSVSKLITRAHYERQRSLWQGFGKALGLLMQGRCCWKSG